jgi:predicted Zn-dependent peptidase
MLKRASRTLARSASVAAFASLSSLASIGLLTSAGCGGSPTPPPSDVSSGGSKDTKDTKPSGKVGGLDVDVDYKKLDNGLKVVLSRDTTSPVATVAIYYNIGFRIEPRDRTGFAHLFEHLMFQGSKNLGKMEFIRLVQSNGGIINGSTRFDFTNYMQIVPSNTVETMLWGEADRMRGPAITQENLTNQQGVVGNEVKGNVINTPYGGFPWLDVPQYANENWYNAHNFYGDLKDIEAATLDDAKKFFDTFYAPNNAAVVVSGDIDKEQTLGWIKKYFGPIRAVSQPAKPDISEPRQEKEKRASRPDALATRPALAVAYHTPARGTAEYYAMGLLDQILLQGKDSRLYQAIVQRRGLAGDVEGGINVGLGNMFNINGPALWTAHLIHDADKTADAIIAVIDEEIERLQKEPVDKETLELARGKMRSALYRMIESMYGFGRADLLACFALFDDDPSKINRLEDEFAKVTPEVLLATAREYLRKTNRTVLAVEPKPAPKAADEGAGAKPAAGDKGKKPAPKGAPGTKDKPAPKAGAATKKAG